MSPSRAIFGLRSTIADTLFPASLVYAHCDIPCGIYDPHEAQISALTVLRMTQLIAELPKPAAGAKPEETEAYHAKLSRYVSVKDIHAEKTKSELRILWGDYFTADHAKTFPTLTESFWKAMKAASKARQSTAVADAQELLGQVQGIAELFWKSKGATTRRQPSMQKSGGEIVYPVSA
jgi:nickel superoxide dismutase